MKRFVLALAAMLVLAGCAAPPQGPSTPRPNYSQQLSAYLYQGFGGAGNPQFQTSWYRYIKSVTVDGEPGSFVVQVNTDLWNDSDATQPANAIKGAVLGWDKGVSSVSVYGRDQNGEALLTSHYR